MLPPALEAFSRLPFWNALFLLLPLSIVAYSGWALARRRQRQDLYYLLLGLYLVVVQLPIVFPLLSQPFLLDLHPLEFSSRFFVALPAIALFVLGVRAR
ncbi:MAG: hypothetical protein ACYC3V_04300 [Chloroflexota bacterium]